MNGTGGSPGPNTSNALSHGTTGNNLNGPSAGTSQAGSTSSGSTSYSNPTTNKAINNLGNTNNTGILAPGSK